MWHSSTNIFKSAPAVLPHFKIFNTTIACLKLKYHFLLPDTTKLVFLSSLTAWMTTILCEDCICTFIKMTLCTKQVSGFIFSSSVVGGTTLLFSGSFSCRGHLFKSWMKDEFVCFFSFLLVEELFPLLLLWYWKCSSFTVGVSLFIAIVINNVKWMRPFFTFLTTALCFDLTPTLCYISKLVEYILIVNTTLFPSAPAETKHVI